MEENVGGVVASVFDFKLPVIDMEFVGPWIRETWRVRLSGWDTLRSGEGMVLTGDGDGDRN